MLIASTSARPPSWHQYTTTTSPSPSKSRSFSLSLSVSSLSVLVSNLTSPSPVETFYEQLPPTCPSQRVLADCHPIDNRRCHLTPQPNTAPTKVELGTSDPPNQSPSDFPVREHSDLQNIKTLEGTRYLVVTFPPVFQTNIFHEHYLQPAPAKTIHYTTAQPIVQLSAKSPCLTTTYGQKGFLQLDPQVYSVPSTYIGQDQGIKTSSKNLRRSLAGVA